MTARCLACGSLDFILWAEAEDIEYGTSSTRYAYHRCMACGCLFIDPVPPDVRRIYPPTYYSYQKGGRGWVWQVKAWLDTRMFRRILGTLTGAELSVLDIGGGHGAMLDTIRSCDPRVTFTQVVDLDHGAQAHAIASGHHFHLGPIETFDASRRFDLILMLNLIEHVAEPLKVLSRVAALLAPGGVVLVKTPNHHSLDARLFRMHSWAGLHCPRHWVIFTGPAFTELVSKAGLGLRSLRYTQGAPFWAASILGLFRGAEGAARGRPLYRNPLLAPLVLLFAGFDFLRRPFCKTSQMLAILERSDEVRPPIRSP